MNWAMILLRATRNWLGFCDGWWSWHLLWSLGAISILSTSPGWTSGSRLPYLFLPQQTWQIEYHIRSCNSYLWPVRTQVYWYTFKTLPSFGIVDDRIRLKRRHLAVSLWRFQMLAIWLLLCDINYGCSAYQSMGRLMCFVTTKDPRNTMLSTIMLSTRPWQLALWRWPRKMEILALPICLPNHSLSNVKFPCSVLFYTIFNRSTRTPRPLAKPDSLDGVSMGFLGLVAPKYVCALP